MKEARKREALLSKYIFFNHEIFLPFKTKVLELADEQHHFLMPGDNGSPKVTLEGGDVMVVSENHVVIGVSERTSRQAAAQTARLLFERNIVNKVTVIQIPKKRDYMHIDTVFTQVKKNVWVMMNEFSNKKIAAYKSDTIDSSLSIRSKSLVECEIIQFYRNEDTAPVHFASLEDLLVNISVADLGCRVETVKIILSGNDEFPFDVREQWTDSCNLLALNEGVVLGYDRNDKTADAFREAGFDVVTGTELIKDLEDGLQNADDIKDTLILMPSAELSRARGGFHCMSMPLLRE